MNNIFVFWWAKILLNISIHETYLIILLSAIVILIMNLTLNSVLCTKKKKKTSRTRKSYAEEKNTNFLIIVGVTKGVTKWFYCFCSITELICDSRTKSSRVNIYCDSAPTRRSVSSRTIWWSVPQRRKFPSHSVLQLEVSHLDVQLPFTFAFCQESHYIFSLFVRDPYRN